MTLPDIRIDYLADHPELLDDLAWLSWKEWQEIYEQREQTLEHCLKNYRERMNTDRLPLTLVAVRGRLAVNSPELLGMVSLKFHDMDTRPDLDPWLGGLLVLPEWRSRGVGTMLMHRATEEARRLNVSQLYLWTHSAERLYQKLDWQVVERTNYFGKEAVVMERNLQWRLCDSPPGAPAPRVAEDAHITEVRSQRSDVGDQIRAAAFDSYVSFT